ncbi:MAG: NAD-dependent epimerase/dehydratase family protein [Clostridiales bacterium]|nr:NAD-dependent epimerase/dehydratase family protein [Clostridiales bacterium]
MNILVTGAKGFVGRNLCASLRNLQEGKDRTRQLKIDEILEYDVDTDPALLDGFCRKADFVFHLAGVNRPRDAADYLPGNFGFTSVLLETLKKHGNPCPVMLASSVQAALIGRYAGSAYGASKLAAEELLLRYADETGARALVYRLPNLFGKWCRPNYNSVVATFCDRIANELPFTVDDPDTELTLLYIDDLLDGLLDALEGREQRCEYEGLTAVPAPHGRYCYIPTVHRIRLGELAALLQTFHDQPRTLMLPELPKGSFAGKLYATYLSYLPKEKIAFPLKTNVDERGGFTELLKTPSGGQFSVCVSRPGRTRGEHWHHSKWEIFLVVAGHGLIRERNIWSDEVLEFEVSGEQLTAVHMLPGCTHSIINLSQTENLVTVMWASEVFDPQHPDTFSEPVEVE